MERANVERQEQAHTLLNLPEQLDREHLEYRRYQVLVQRAVEVFGDAITASRWLSTPSADFRGRVPLQVAEEHDYSLDPFESMFIRIEHGIDY